MRKSRWAAAGGLGSLVLALAACGGSSSSSTAANATAAPSTSIQSAASSASASGSSPASATAGAASSSAKAKASASASKEVAAESKPSSNTEVSFPPVGTTVLIVQKSSIGYVMAKADGYVVYTYSKDTKGHAPSCTGSCASAWAPVTGMPKAGPADTFPGSFAVVNGSSGAKDITYNGYPLYTMVGAPVLSTKGDGVDGEWHVIKLSASNITP
jgi:predicted lipoprotein with Yx(FWY)xxD motif